jgi:competence protein ComEA
MFRIAPSFAAAMLVVSSAVAVSSAAAQTSAPQSSPKSSAHTAASAVAPSTVININTATPAELDGLPGIGAKTAARIVEYRQKNGPFKKIEELMNVRGVGEKNFLKLKDRITVAPAKADRQ